MKKTSSRSPSRLSSRFWIAVLLWWLCAPFALAQSSPVLTIDLDRLFAETRLGAETLAQLEQQAQALSEENNQIETALIEEERDLTEKRAELKPEEFRPLADAFDQRVQQFRAEQDEKARALTRTRDEARAAFFNDVAAIISNIVREKGAVVVLERRDVFLSADSIDITDEAILRVNEAKGRSE